MDSTMCMEALVLEIEMEVELCSWIIIELLSC